MKGKPWRAFGTAEMPYLDQLLQPSLLTTVTNSASARSHLRAITALKRSRPGPQQIWHVYLLLYCLCLGDTLMLHSMLLRVFNAMIYVVTADFSFLSSFCLCQSIFGVKLSES